MDGLNSFFSVGASEGEALEVSKALYSAGDHRHNPYSVKDVTDARMAAVFKKQVNSVACLVLERRLTDKGDSFEISAPTLKERIGLAPGEKFSEEPAPGEGTAFSVGNGLALTAGHCFLKKGASGNYLNEVDGEDVRTLRLLFGYQIKKEGQFPTKIKKDLVFRVSRVLFHSNGTANEDWALLQLDRETRHITPLLVDFNRGPVLGESIYMLGHPSSLPLKFTDTASIGFRIRGNPKYFYHAIDAFAGNSGSPVFSKISNKVIGILIRGLEDYEGETGAKRAAHYTGRSDSETCQKVLALPDKVRQEIYKATKLDASSYKSSDYDEFHKKDLKKFIEEKFIQLAKEKK